eukprot:Partr_v1_DN27688_c0_g1_i3_m65225 putative Type-I myosin implicated in the organization of the actin cytoskeleton. Required for proper actin cytoskeleton polarization. At the cell cortex, assembles in patch-like structures together with proteins from the actin-polymerizing machinery and promotes actin assembly. Functions as actin nucleation-promoting factor (NPF) for the Arp2 3 complex
MRARSMYAFLLSCKVLCHVISYGNVHAKTYIGHVLISVNPFQDLGIYGRDVLERYVGRARIEMPPHIYAIAESSFRNMCIYEEDQCVIISGESGAGKTEAAKKILHYVTEVSVLSSADASRGGASVKDRLLSTNPLFESFGNACTLRNNNSSRFGKYMSVHFGADHSPIGAVTLNYLLEKSRVVYHCVGERNYHIFYQLLAGASAVEREQLCLYSSQDYYYTSQGNTPVARGIDDVACFAETRNALSTLGCDASVQFKIFRLLAAILWLGNVEFQEGNGAGASISNGDVVDHVAHLLSMDSKQLRDALTFRFMETKAGARGTAYSIPLNTVQASATRDALAKAIYEKLFDFIIASANVATRMPDHIQS